MHETVTLKLPTKLLSEAQVLATTRGISIAEMLRQYLDAETSAFGRKPDQGWAITAAHLAPIFEAAKDWEALQKRLLERGYTLRAMGTGLALYTARDGKHFCNTATVGFRYRKLVKKYNSPMPGHRHGMKWVASCKTSPTNFDVIDRGK